MSGYGWAVAVRVADGGGWGWRGVAGGSETGVVHPGSLGRRVLGIKRWWFETWSRHSGGEALGEGEAVGLRYGTGCGVGVAGWGGTGSARPAAEVPGSRHGGVDMRRL